MTGVQTCALPISQEDGYIRLENTEPGQIRGYWLTYGSDDRLTDYASLFGYDTTLKALRAFGDSFLSEGNTPPKLNRYHSPEYGYTGYYLLTHNPRVLQELSKRWHKHYRTARGPRVSRQLSKHGHKNRLSSRNPGLLRKLSSRGHNKRRSTLGEPLAWDSYSVKGTAEQWHKLTKQGYGKNGFKIHAANVVENIYGFAAFEHRRMLKARTAKQ